MATRINPPTFNIKVKGYELYKQELTAWGKITDLDKKKRGIAIALTLPEDDDTKIREKVFDQLKLEDLEKDTGLDTLITFLDSHLGKDDLADSLEKFEDFEDFERAEGQSINEFIAMFDSKYRKVEKKKITLLPEILAFKLLRKAKITKEEKMLVLTGMDYEHKETLYEQAKKSLKKFKGEAGHSKGEIVNTNIKLEPAFLAQNEEALLAAGYVKRGNSYSGYKRGGRSGRGYGRGQAFNSSQRATKNLNPTGVDGKVLTCRSCGSYRHLVANCLDSWENLSKVNITESEQEADDFVLFTGYQKQNITELGNDARNCAVLDSACTSTVCGKTWLNRYVDSLSNDDKSKIINKEGHRVFKFGGGTRLKSEGEYELPIYLVGKQVKLHTDVVDSDIPLLLSKPAMKTAGVKLDLVNDTAVILGKEVALNLTSSGHYCVPVDKTETLLVQEVNSVNLEGLGSEKRRSVLLKLHRQFAHPPKKRLIALLKDAGAWRDEYEMDLSDIQDKCQLCKIHAVTPPRPAVSLPMAKQFNEKVAIDLKKYKGRWILHMIDMWSRYTVSVFIERKKPSNVIDGLMKNWIGLFGVMGSLMSDNGGEFSSDEMREIASILNVRVCTTAGMSPFQNGLCERVHAVTDMMLMKLEAENKHIEPETLLAWANMARNTLQMWSGYSSNQLVFGRNPTLPNIMQSELPALDGKTSSETFHKHLNALYETRKAYIKSEADERIRRALRCKVRAAEQIFENGDMVFYKREGKEKWLGPGKVVFQDGKVVFVRHGSIYVRVSPNRLSKASTLDFNSNEDDKTDYTPKQVYKEEVPFERKQTFYEIFEEKENAESHDLPNNVQNVVEGQLVVNPSNVQSNFGELQNIKSNDRIQYKLPNSDEWINSTIMGRAGKATGGNKYWYNVHDVKSNEERSIDLGKVEWRHFENQTEVEETNVISEDNDAESNFAKQIELQKLQTFDTYVEVPYTGQTLITTRWVMSKKNGETRARLVVRGFQERNLIPSDSPTIGKGAIRLFLTIVASMKWNLKMTDIKSAFLQGNELEREVYIKPPIESGTSDGFVWKLKHGLYGLKDGARQFYISVRDELISLGLTQMKLDPAMFTYFKDGQLHGIICCHVDDFLHAGTEIFDALMTELRKRFIAGKIVEKSFQYIGFEITQDQQGVYLEHSIFTNKLNEHSVKLEPKRACEKTDQLTPEEQREYRRLIGQLNWAVQGSRPDLAYELVDLSTKLKTANISDLQRAIRNIGKLKDVQPIQYFPSLKGTPKEDWEIFLFCDAALANLNDGKGSTGAHILWIKDRLGNCCPIYWQSNKIKRVVRSTIASEALSLQEGLESALYFRTIVEEIFRLERDSIPVTGFTDNKSVTEALKTTKLVDDKRLRIDIASIKEMILNNNVQVKWCPGKVQLANSLTKRGAHGMELLKVIQTGKLPEEFM